MMGSVVFSCKLKMKRQAALGLHLSSSSKTITAAVILWPTDQSVQSRWIFRTVSVFSVTLKHMNRMNMSSSLRICSDGCRGEMCFLSTMAFYFMCEDGLLLYDGAVVWLWRTASDIPRVVDIVFLLFSHLVFGLKLGFVWRNAKNNQIN